MSGDISIESFVLDTSSSENGRMEECFRSFDCDKDDKWSVAEFGAVCRSLLRNADTATPHMLEAKKLAEMFTVFDQDGDGFIDRCEFDFCWHNWIKSVVDPVCALIIVDVQNDFISGTLAVSNCPAGHKGEEVVPVVNYLLDNVNFSSIVYSMDWHPANHISFIDNVLKYPLHSSSKVLGEGARVYDTVVFDGDPVKEQVLWPPHCVQQSWGAELHPDLKVVDEAVWIKKGHDPEIDSYSAFFDNAKCSDTGLARQLRQRSVTDVFVCGIATDICVAATALHSLDEHFATVVVDDACRGVNGQDIDQFCHSFTERHGVIVRSPQVAAMAAGRDRRPEMAYIKAVSLRAV